MPKEIVPNNSVICYEELPFPVVHYPDIYATYFAFSKSKSSVPYLCSCSMESIENHIKLNIKFLKDNYNSNPNLFFVLDFRHFPKTLKDFVKINKLPNNENIISRLYFENKICHECNGKLPQYRFCHEMYGGTFRQNYGWYINKQFYEYGIMPSTNYYIPELCPQEILELIEIDPSKFYEIQSKIGMVDPLEFGRLLNDFLVETFGENPFERDAFYELNRKFERQKRKISNIIENAVREKFGFKKIGDAWTSETILYYIIKKLLPDKTIYRHYRPNFLHGLELDIFIEEFRLGIEYQGIQHFKPVRHWGGKEALERTKYRDKRKRELCLSNNVDLICFDYDEELGDDYVHSRLNKYINEISGA